MTEHISALDKLLGAMLARSPEDINDDGISLIAALEWAIPILRSTAPAVETPEADYDGTIAAAQRRLVKRRLAAGLDPATGRPLQAPIVGVARTDAATVPSTTSGILALVEGAAAGKVRLDPGKAPIGSGDE